MSYYETIDNYLYDENLTGFYRKKGTCCAYTLVSDTGGIPLKNSLHSSTENAE